MEGYILDDSLRRTETIETFESFIWTERWASPGDFILEVPAGSPEAPLLQKGLMLACDKSDRVMIIQTVENLTTDDGAKMVKASGLSLEVILEERPNRYNEIVTPGTKTGITLGNGTTDKPADLVRTLFNAICVTNTAFSNADRIPFMEATAYYSQTGAIGWPIDTPVIQSELDTLYNTIKAICDTYRIGFRIVRIEPALPADPVKLYFELFMGFDRTTGQTTFPAIVFSEAMDNLANVSELESIGGMKNVAYVFSATSSAVVYAPGIDSSVAGFQKKVLIVDANDITVPNEAAKMSQRGLSELAKYRRLIGFDGEIPQNSGLRYNIDYILGDLVEQRAENGTKKVMRVSEQIFTSDKDGEKSYPTLIIDTLVEPGTWDAVIGSRHWDDATGTWDAN